MYYNLYLQALGLEVDPGFHPYLVSHQPNPARQPLSEFLLHLGPDHHLLLQLNNGQIVTLRDFKPVRNHICIQTTCLFGFLFLKILPTNFTVKLLFCGESSQGPVTGIFLYPSLFRQGVQTLEK